MTRVSPIIAFLLLLRAAVALAQNPVDLRLSPREPDFRSLPVTLRYQSAATVDKITLAVWLTTINDDRGSLVPVIRMQLLRDGIPVNGQQTVNDLDTWPLGLVKVVPASGAFLVLWNNSQGSELSTHARRVGLDGSLLGPGWKAADGMMAGDGPEAVQVLGNPGLGQAIVWNQQYGSCTMLRIDAAANPIGSAVDLGEKLDQVFTYSQLPGLYLLRLTNSGRVIYTDGHIDSRSVPLDSLTRAFYIDADSSLVTLAAINGNQGARTARRYHSMFDTAPFHLSHSDMLDSASVPMRDRSCMLAVARDSSGNYEIFFSLINVGVYDIGFPYGAEAVERTFTIYRYTDSVNGNSSVPERIFDATKTPDFVNRIMYNWTTTNILNGNSSTDRIVFQFGTIIHTQTDSQGIRVTTFEFSFDSSGVFKFDRSYGTPFETADNGRSGFIPPGIPVDSSTSILRVASDTMSVVRVSVRGHEVELSSPTGSYASRAGMWLPSIYSFHGALLTSWIRDDNGAADLARWDGISVVPIDRMLIDSSAFPEPDSSMNGNLLAADAKIAWDAILAAGPPTFARTYERVDSMLVLSLWGYLPVNMFQRHNDVGMATPKGWKPLISTTLVDQYVEPTANWLRDIGWDPNRHEVVVASSTDGWPGGMLSAFDPDGSLIWSDRCVADTGTILSVAPSRYLLVTADSVFSYDGVNRIAAVAVPPATGPAIFSRLLGSWFVRITRPGAFDRRVIERFDLEGHRIDSLNLKFPSQAVDLRLVQSENDSTLILLYLRDGVRMTRLTQDLHVLLQDSLISIARADVAHPAAAMRNDTLFAVWEDDRDGEPAIYGNWIRLETIHDTATAGVQSPDISAGISTELVRLYPNPARGAVRIDYHSSKESELEVIDPLGRIVRRMMVPASPNGSVNLSTSDIESGIYLVRLGSGGAASTARLVVAR